MFSKIGLLSQKLIKVLFLFHIIAVFSIICTFCSIIMKNFRSFLFAQIFDFILLVIFFYD